MDDTDYSTRITLLSAKNEEILTTTVTIRKLISIGLIVISVLLTVCIILLSVDTQRATDIVEIIRKLI